MNVVQFSGIHMYILFCSFGVYVCLKIMSIVSVRLTLVKKYRTLQLRSYRIPYLPHQMLQYYMYFYNGQMSNVFIHFHMTTGKRQEHS